MNNGFAKCFAAAGLAAAIGPAVAAKVATVSPQGVVPEVRQVSVRFAEAVVAEGDPRAAAPFTLLCNGTAVPGNSRWASATQWLFDLRQPLAAGSACVLRAVPSWQPRGGTLEGPAEFRFDTGAPTIVQTQPWVGSRIEEDQHFLLRLNGAVDPASLRANAWCEVEGLGERVPLRVVVGGERNEVLRTRRIADGADWLLVRCDRALASDSGVRIVWGAGIAAAGRSGLVTTTPRRFEWRVRERFHAEFGCERENAQAPCLPLRPMSLRFSAPVERRQALAARLVPEQGKPIDPRVPPHHDKDEWITELRFAAPLPESARFSLTLPAALRDQSGRALANATSFPLKVATGVWPPLAKFAAAPFGVVEAGADAMLPLTLRHVQADLQGAATGGRVAIKRFDADTPDAELLRWIARVAKYHEAEITAREAGLPRSQWTITERETDERGRVRTTQRDRLIGTREVSLLAGEHKVKRSELPQLASTVPRATEVLGVPLPEPGYHVVEVESRVLGEALLGKRAPMYARSGVLVTNLGVHFKRGRSSSLVWVTTIDRANPVPGARVAVNDCHGTPLWTGTTDAQGIARIDRGFDDDGEACPLEPGQFVTARKTGADGRDQLAFVFSHWRRGIESWRFNLPTGHGAAGADRRAHTVFDRTLVRAGETVSMKHFVRDETERGLAMPARDALPDTVVITHVGSNAETVIPLHWGGGARSAESRFDVPKSAKLGLYDVALKRGDTRLPSGSFRVEAFRVPLVDARLSAAAGVQVAPTKLVLAAQLNLNAGGPLPRVPVRLSALLRPLSPAFAGLEDFSFEPPRPAAPPPDDDLGRDAARLVADRIEATTDAQGAATIELPKLPAIDRPSQLLAELSFNDPNGEVQTVSQRVRLAPAGVVVGLRARSWAALRGEVRANAVVLDPAGKPLADREIEVLARVRQVHTTRKRIVGGFYAYDNRVELRELGLLCKARSDAQGRIGCDTTVAATGEIELIARARDAEGRVAEGAASVWVVGEDEQWFAQDNDDRIDLLPEKRELEPGQTARLQVRMPFRHATALVTVEREGIIASRVMALTSREPVIELPVPKGEQAASWAPNVAVSVLVMRGRIRHVPWTSFFGWGWREPLEWWRAFRYEGREWRAPTALVDLAKPSFKLGVAELKVGLTAHRLDVTVAPERGTYAVRETVKTRITVGFGGKPAAGAQVAFAAVDEGLLALRDNDSWRLLEAMFRPRPWSVDTATAQSEIVGRRHYGRKTLPPGGDGGGNPTRELFDTLLLWRGTVALDANGQATVEVPLNDSLTSFRLVAVADDGADRFGHGSATVRVSQDLQLFSGLPPVARDGDRFDAVFTLRNTTPRAMDVKVQLEGKAGAKALAFAPQRVALAAGAAAELRWPVELGAGSERIEWAAEAVEADGRTRDRIKVVQRIDPAVPLRVWQASLQPLETSVALPLAPPADALADGAAKAGGVIVGLTPKLSGSLPGLRRWFETYPYTCLEQKASRAIGLRDPALWSAVGAEVAHYLDRDGLAAYFPARAEDAPRGSDKLTAYLISAAHEAGWAWPEPAREAMLQGLAAFVEGRLMRTFFAPRADLDVRKLAALEALSRHGRAAPRMLGSITIAPATWPTSALLDWWAVLRRVEAIPDRAARLEEVQRTLRARLIQGGTTLRLSTEDSDHWWWLMEGPDANAARLLLAASDAPAWREDAPRLVQGHLGRARQGAWATTTANLWSVLALERFAARFEATPVSGRSQVAWAGSAREIDWQTPPESLRLPWPAGGAAKLQVKHQGSGRPWLTVQSLAAVPLRAPLASGYRITRTVTAIERRHPDAWTRGDIARVRIEVEAAADMAWVVLTDPLPAGAALLGGGLGRDSALAARGERREGSAWLAFEERGAEAWRGYYEWMPRGRHVAEYTLRLNASGRFGLPPTRVEAMYAPDAFGEAPNAAWEVQR
jgi:hypothetical protein